MRHGWSQEIDLGAIKAVRLGGPSPFTDLYYRTMEVSWPAFVGFVCLCFAALNLVFGTLYALLPGAIANTTPGSLTDGIFFSIETLGTVGYGHMYPATRVGHTVAAAEILIGLFFSATMTGLIFARFSRPRVGIVFSNRAVIGRHEGKPALMLRVASMRSRPLVNAQAQVAWLQTTTHQDGTPLRRRIPLGLVRDHNPMLGLSWTLIHVLERDSPLLATWRGDKRFLLTATVRGTDTLLAGPTVGSHRYARDQVLPDRQFVDMISGDGDTLCLDLSLLHATKPIDPAA